MLAKAARAEWAMKYTWVHFWSLCSLLILLSACRESEAPRVGPPPFLKGGIQKGYFVSLQAGVALRRPGNDWNFDKEKPGFATGPHGRTVQLLAEPRIPGQTEPPDEAQMAQRVKSLERSGYVVVQENWEYDRGVNLKGYRLEATKSLAGGQKRYICEAHGMTGRASLVLVLRGSSKSLESDDFSPARELDRIADGLVWFEPMSPLVGGAESKEILLLLDRWVRALSQADSKKFLACYHHESQMIPLEKVFIEKWAPAYKIQGSYWKYKKETLMIDGQRAVARLQIARVSKTKGTVLQESPLKVKFRRDGTSWRIFSVEAL